MIPKYVYRSKIFGEFSPEEQEQYFGLKDKCVRSHIDTLYYFVKIRGDTNDTENTGILTFLAELADLKERKKSSYSSMIDFHGLSVEANGFSIYEYRLSLPEMFDIFISSYIPNDETPRIVVQLRTRSLVLEGPYEAVRNSMKYVREILSEYDLMIGLLDVNRVDYAYHTNMIQNPIKYFNDEKLKKCLSSSLRKYMKVGTVGDDVTLETLSLGNRKSNNIFFRCYDKTREVIEKGYKSFFIEKWKEDGLISEYDYYVLMYAYENHSYVAGLHIGRMLWYIRYGHDESLKEKFYGLMEKYRKRSDNNKRLREQIDDYAELENEIEGLLPKTTLVMNIEFQTKRKFYCELSEMIENVNPDCEPEYRNIFSVIALRASIQKYLTSETVCWFCDRKKRDKALDWWKRIQNCEIESAGDYGNLVRHRDLNSDIRKTERRLKITIAHMQILRNLSTEPKTFHEDASDVLSYLNDNDFYGFGKNPLGGQVILKQKDYGDIRERKARQDKGLVKSVQLKKELIMKMQEENKNLKNNEEI